MILEKLGIPARAWDFQFVTSAPENMISAVLLHLRISNHCFHSVTSVPENMISGVLGHLSNRIIALDSEIKNSDINIKKKKKILVKNLVQSNVT